MELTKPAFPKSVQFWHIPIEYRFRLKFLKYNIYHSYYWRQSVVAVEVLVLSLVSTVGIAFDSNGGDDEFFALAFRKI